MAKRYFYSERVQKTQDNNQEDVTTRHLPIIDQGSVSH